MGSNKCKKKKKKKRGNWKMMNFKEMAEEEEEGSRNNWKRTGSTFEVEIANTPTSSGLYS